MLKTTILFLLSICCAFAQQIDFEAKAIIALSDADMAASAYIDGKLLKEKSAKDMFSFIRFPLERSNEEIKTLAMPNSVLTWTKSMAISADNRFAFVLDVRGSLPDTVQQIRSLVYDFPSGNYLTVLDINSTYYPSVKFKFPVGRNPLAVDAHPFLNLVAVCSAEDGKEFSVIEFDENGKPLKAVTKGLYQPGVRVTDITWHPSGEYLAYTLEETREIGLLKVIRDQNTGRVRSLDHLGKPIKVGTTPAAGQFTPNGAYYIIPDMKWGDAAKNEYGYDGKGELNCVAFNFDGFSEHIITYKLKVGESPEAFAINPDGNLIALVTMNKTFYPWDNASLSPKSTITLLKLSSDGSMEAAQEVDFDGILPKSIAFDKTGNNLALSVYEYFDYGKRTGGIEFWKVNKGIKPTIQKQATKIQVPRGCHTIKIISK